MQLGTSPDTKPASSHRVSHRLRVLIMTTPMHLLQSLHCYAIIAMANHLHLILHQVDIKGAYLNGMLWDDEVLYL